MAGPRPLARDRWLARPPLPAVAQAAQTQQWHPAIHWALVEWQKKVIAGLNSLACEIGSCSHSSHLTYAAPQRLASAPAPQLDSPQLLVRMRDWLTNAVRHPGVSQDRAMSRIVATAYEHDLLPIQRKCRGKERRVIARIAACMRDVIVLAAVSDAGGHRDQGAFKHALSEAFGRQLDKSDLEAQMEHSYHQLTHGVPGAFVSGCKRGRLRHARVRQLADESTSDAEGEGYDSTREASSTREPAENVQLVRGVGDASQPMHDPTWEPTAPDLAELRRIMKTESDRLWKALERADLRTVREALENAQAEVKRLTAKLDPGTGKSGLFELAPGHDGEDTPSPLQPSTASRGSEVVARGSATAASGATGAQASGGGARSSAAPSPPGLSLPAGHGLGVGRSQGVPQNLRLQEANSAPGRRQHGQELQDLPTRGQASGRDGWLLVGRGGGDAFEEAAVAWAEHVVAQPTCNMSRVDVDGGSALCIRGHLQVVKHLVAQPGVDTNKTTEDGRTALMAAASSGHLEMVKFLVEMVKFLVRTCKGGLTALAFAAIRGKLDVVRYLVAQTARRDDAPESAGRGLAQEVQPPPPVPADAGSGRRPPATVADLYPFI